MPSSLILKELRNVAPAGPVSTERFPNNATSSLFKVLKLFHYFCPKRNTLLQLPFTSVHARAVHLAAGQVSGLALPRVCGGSTHAPFPLAKTRDGNNSVHVNERRQKTRVTTLWYVLNVCEIAPGPPKRRQDKSTRFSLQRLLRRPNQRPRRSPVLCKGRYFLPCRPAVASPSSSRRSRSCAAGRPRYGGGRPGGFQLPLRRAPRLSENA